LDDTLGTLSIGGSSKQNSRPPSSADNRFDTISSTASFNGGASVTDSRISSVLDSGDEVWTNFADPNASDIPTPAQAQIQMQTHRRSPYALPPPPSISRNNSSSSTISASNSIQSQRPLVLPAYRSPPPPHKFNHQQPTQLQNSHPNNGQQFQQYAIPSSMSRGASSARSATINDRGFIEAVKVLSSLVPTASGFEIAEALKRFMGNITEAEKLLKIDQLHKLGLGEKMQCEGVLSKSNWNLEAAASVLVEQSLQMS
jgi:hypothetical protein